MGINYYALSFVFNDSKGIVSDTAKILYEHGFNIADSSSTLLQGIFSMIFIVTSEKDYTEQDVKKMFETLPCSMEVFKYKNIPESSDELYHYSISVYGADKPGIVHAITHEIAENKLNIIDLQTKVTGKDSKVYIMMLEVTADSENNENIWQEKLKNIAKQINTQINIKKIQVYEL